jgi:tetratricopeptide (TPR) repeat protein
MSRYQNSVLLFAYAVLVIGGCEAGRESTTPASEIEARIRFYASKLEKSTRLYPVHVQLAAAYFDKARETSDSKWLVEARKSLDRSIAIVGTYEAFIMAARIANYAHRHEDAIVWGNRAAQSRPADPAVVTILVEAYSGLGRYEEARDLLPPEGTQPVDPYTAAALAGWLSSQGRHEEAARAFDATAELARATELPMVTWSQAMAAGCLLHAGQLALARSRLAALRSTSPHDILIRLNDAERLAAEQRPAEALDLYEELIDERPSDADLHAKAYNLARLLKRDALARRHFAAAEGSLRAALDAGEVYTLGALSQLYVEAGIHLDEAVALAERNIHFKNDREARAILANATSRLAAAAPQ